MAARPRWSVTPASRPWAPAPRRGARSTAGGTHGCPPASQVRSHSLSRPLPGAISCSHFPKSTWRGAGGWASPGAVLAGRILSGIALGSVAELSLPAGCTHEVQKCTRIKIPTQFTSSGEFSPSFFPFPSPPPQTRSGVLLSLTYFWGFPPRESSQC